MEQLNYQAQQFEDIVPVLDVGDPSESLASAYQYSGADQSAILNRMKQDQDIQSRNLKQKLQGFEDIMKFSSTAVKEVAKIKRQQTKDEASAVWAEAYNNFESPTQKELSSLYTAAEESQVESKSDIDKALTANLQAKGDKITPMDSADAGKVRTRTGLMGVVQANARAQASMDSYGPAFKTFLQRANAGRAKQKGKVNEKGELLDGSPVQPGSQFRNTLTEFNKLWADKTGMAMANPGYTAKYVYPKLRREAAQLEEEYTKSWNVQHADIQLEKNLLELRQTKDLNKFFTAQKGLTTRDGVSLQTNSDVYSILAQAQFSSKELTDFGDSINPVTNKPFSSHPRFQSLKVDARKRAVQLHNLSKNEFNIVSLEGFNNTPPNAEANEAERIRQLALPNADPNIINRNYSSAMARTDRKIEVQQETARINNLLDRMGPDYKLTPADMDGAPNELWNTFAGRLAPNANAEKTDEMIRKSDTFKSIEKDLDGIIAKINPNIKPANMLTGTSAASNLNLFKQDAMSEIALRAQSLMLGGELTQDQAIREATKIWTDEQKALEAKEEFFDAGKNEFKSSATQTHYGLVQATEMQLRNLKNTKITDLQSGLYESDYLADTNGRFSERVRFLGRQFGKTPSQIVAMARQQKGLPALEATDRELALAEMNPSQRVLMASLGDATPQQVAIRAQITSNQVLTGTAQQRAISVGQQLYKMGYAGLWQNDFFDHDRGYVKGGGQENSGHSAQGFHPINQAIDVGIQANGAQRLKQLYAYLYKEKDRFGISELFYADQGWSKSRGPGAIGGHGAHLHVAFD